MGRGNDGHINRCDGDECVGAESVSYAETVSDNKTGRRSSTRVVQYWSGITLCWAMGFLTAFAPWHPELVPVLSILAPSLAGLAASSYAMNKYAATKEPKEGGL